MPPKIDLGPLFVDKDAGEESEDEDADPEYPYSRRRLRGAMLKLRGFWGFS